MLFVFINGRKFNTFKNVFSFFIVLVVYCENSTKNYLTVRNTKNKIITISTVENQPHSCYYDVVTTSPT